MTLEDRIGYLFNKKELLKEALTHKSFSAGAKAVKHNERLEFLGDSILGMVVADYVYTNLPEVEEGVLSKIKSSLVSRRNLYFWGAELELGKYLNLGAGEEATGGRERESIISNTVEAVIGAVYLDGGMTAVRQVTAPWLEKQKLALNEADFKSNLQELCQKQGKKIPVYEILQTVGPEHDKIFTVAVYIDGKEAAVGKGKNKKLAEQQAAEKALENPVFKKTKKR